MQNPNKDPYPTEIPVKKKPEPVIEPPKDPDLKPSEENPKNPLPDDMQ